MKLNPTKRYAGLFVPSFALRSEGDQGIGDTRSVMAMIQLCQELDLHVLQLLPINETSDDHSPYNAISSIALEPTTMSCRPEDLPGLTAEDYAELVPAALLQELAVGPVNYRKVVPLKRACAARAFANLNGGKVKWPAALKKEWQAFRKEEAGWLDDYTLFRSLLEKHGHPGWLDWPEEHRTFASAGTWVKGLSKAEGEAFEAIRELFAFIQWALDRQWKAVRAAADAAQVALMGDIPFGVSKFSADVWANPSEFDLHWSGGAPPEPFFQPDLFTKVWGQNWGVPLYRWGTMKKNDFIWWRRRVRGVGRHFHAFRIDHVLGFYRIFAFPWPPQENHIYAELNRQDAFERAGDLPRFVLGNDAIPNEARQNEEQGTEILKVVLDAAGDTVVIAEDLGMVPDYVRPSLQKLGISGFKIPLFDRNEQTREFIPPETYAELTISTLATHDHETMAGIWADWWKTVDRGEKPKATPEEKEQAKQASWEIYRMLRFCRLDDSKLLRPFEPAVREGMIDRLLEGKSWLAVLMITDWLGENLRFNVPGPVAESNWSARLSESVEALRTGAKHAEYRDSLKKQVAGSKRNQ
jgi:4-alpha-glucanotransferase